MRPPRLLLERLLEELLRLEPLLERPPELPPRPLLELEPRDEELDDPRLLELPPRPLLLDPRDEPEEPRPPLELPPLELPPPRPLLPDPREEPDEPDERDEPRDEEEDEPPRPLLEPRDEPPLRPPWEEPFAMGMELWVGTGQQTRPDRSAQGPGHVHPCAVSGTVVRRLLHDVDGAGSDLLTDRYHTCMPVDEERGTRSVGGSENERTWEPKTTPAGTC